MGIRVKVVGVEVRPRQGMATGKVMSRLWGGRGLRRSSSEWGVNEPGGEVEVKKRLPAQGKKRNNGGPDITILTR